MNIFQIETSTIAGLETRTNTLSPFWYVAVKFRYVVVMGGVRWGGGGAEWGINPNPKIEESCS